MEVQKEKITKITDDGAIIFAPIKNIDTALLRQYKTVDIVFKDSRTITNDQRRKAYVLMNFIAEYTGDDLESTKNFLKLDFLKDNIIAMYQKIFSLSNCDVSLAKEFITYLIDFIIKHHIPTDRPMSELLEDVKRYVYSCIKYKKCAVCGDFGEVHHIEAIGMGNDRKRINHRGLKAISLCRVHHTEAHKIGNENFLKKYHLEPIALNKELCKIHNLNTKEK